MPKRKKRRTKRRTKKRESFFERLDIDHETKRDIGAIGLFILSVVFFLSIFDLAGRLGEWIVIALKWFLGVGYWTLPFVFIALGYLVFRSARGEGRFTSFLGLFVFVLAYAGLFHVRVPLESMTYLLHEGTGGGVLGFLVSYPLLQLAGFWVALVILIGLLIISILLLFNISLDRLHPASMRESFGSVSGAFSRSGGEFDDDDEEEEEEDDWEEEEEDDEFTSSEISEDEEEGDARQRVPAAGSGGEQGVLLTSLRKHPKIDLPMELLKGKSGKPTSGDIDGNREIIERTFEQFGIDVEMGDVSVGPTVTQYTFRPAQGVKLSRVTGLANDLALALAAHPIRIEAPIPGKSLVGVEVPNQKVATVLLKDILESKNFERRSSDVSFAMGKDVSGEAWMADLSTLPHLLIAGATGSGKSVMVNSIILSLLYQNQPGDLKFIMVDPKRVELTGYNGIPHLLTPVITEVDKTINSLRWVVGEMERRFELLSRSKKRNIQSYNKKPVGDKLPYIVVVIDELADLMSVAAAEMEGVIVRLAQMARAVGIHLVLATQRPSVDVITGLIKANVPARIAFSVASLVDSRTILDASGAEKLLGRGDLLFASAALSKPKRLQGAYVSDDEIEAVVEYLKSKDSPDYIDDVTKGSGAAGGPGGAAGDQEDDMFSEARETVVSAQKASASFLQRRLRVGYARAARLIDLLEAAGIVGEANGSKPRDVLMTPEELDAFLAGDAQPGGVDGFVDEDEGEEGEYEEAGEDEDDGEESDEEEEGEEEEDGDYEEEDEDGEVDEGEEEEEEDVEYEGEDEEEGDDEEEDDEEEEDERR